MARTPSVSDKLIIEAATQVMNTRGANAFTLSEVAVKTGLSRAAITLRFESAHALKVAILSAMVEEFERKLDTLPKTPSGNHLLQVSAFIGRYNGRREGTASFFADYATHMKDNQLAALEKRRGEILHQVICRVMPDTNIDHESAVHEFIAHLTGGIISWFAADNISASDFLVARTKKWLQLVGIPFDDPLPGTAAPD